MRCVWVGWCTCIGFVFEVFGPRAVARLSALLGTVQEEHVQVTSACPLVNAMFQLEEAA
jgi:hypothetical protein